MDFPWTKERLLWIGFLKNTNNPDCIFGKLPKDIIRSIITIILPHSWSIPLIETTVTMKINSHSDPYKLKNIRLKDLVHAYLEHIRNNNKMIFDTNKNTNRNEIKITDEKTDSNINDDIVSKESGEEAAYRNMDITDPTVIVWGQAGCTIDEMGRKYRDDAELNSWKQLGITNDSWGIFNYLSYFDLKTYSTLFFEYSVKDFVEPLSMDQWTEYGADSYVYYRFVQILLIYFIFE